MAIIKVLDEILSNKIAAGEVVEKCASVVKELVENSIDANSTEIKVELIESGTKEIRVIDNGNGMDSEDAIRCFERHATSKIFNEDDLYRISTLGFRGEALASIASVSKITLSTSTGEIGVVVEVDSGKIISTKKGDSRKGTIISVRDLFFNTPARLKYLKSLYTELANITDYMNKLALSHPNIRFALSNDGKNILQTDGNGNLLKTIHDVFGAETSRKMIDVSVQSNDYEIEGFIGLPEIHRSNRNGMITIVNGRVVRNTELNKWINDGYHSYKPDNRYPIVVLNISVDTSIVDVNIHPTKMDIKFDKQEELNELVCQMIKERLSKKTLIPTVNEKKQLPKTVEYEPITLDFNDIKEPGLVLNNDFVSQNEEIHEDVKERLPLMYPIGLIHGTYIVCQNELGMYLIDQHAAKERITYEEVKQKLNNQSKEKYPLLVPITIEYTADDFIVLKENFELLRDLDFVIEEFGVSSIIVKEHPIWIPSGQEADNVKRIIEMIIRKEKNFNLERFYDSIAITVACKMSIKANTNISIEEMEHLLNELRKCENPFNCPHGRPTVIHYSVQELERLFKRAGF